MGLVSSTDLAGGEIRKKMTPLGFKASVLHPSVFYNPDKNTFVVVRVDDFWCIGPSSELEELYTSLNNIDDLRSRAKDGQGLDPERSRSARRCIAMLNYLAQARPDLLVATRVAGQCVFLRDVRPDRGH